MIIISNNVKERIAIPKDAVIRVNMAWIKTFEELDNVIMNIKQDIFLDFPQGRTKPPKPVLQMDDALIVMKKYNNIKYFAISNAEDVTTMLHLRKIIPKHVTIVPKIETMTGITNFNFLVRTAKTNIVMLDKEDLYLDVKKQNSIFEALVKKMRQIYKRTDIRLLELQGVIFEERHK